MVLTKGLDDGLAHRDNWNARATALDRRHHTVDVRGQLPALNQGVQLLLRKAEVVSERQGLARYRSKC